MLQRENVLKLTSDKKIVFLLISLYLSLLVQGLNDGALGVAWPSIAKEMTAPLEMAGLLSMTAFTMYSIVVSQFGRISLIFKPQTTTLLGIFIMVFSNLGFFFAPYFFLLFIFIGLVASGQALIEGSINSYLARHFSARHMNWGLCFWGMGATVSPIIVAYMIEGFNWRYGYLAILVIQSIIGILVFFSIKKNVWLKSEKIERTEKIKATSKINISYQALQISLFFFATGTQTMVGFWIYTVMLYRGLSNIEAGVFPALYFGSIMTGRVIFGSMANRVKNMYMIRIGIGIAIFGSFLLMFTNSIVGMAIIGLGFSPIYPCLLHETGKRFSSDVLDRQMGYQMSAAGFGEIISTAMGFILAHISMESLFPVVIIIMFLVFMMNENMELRRLK